MPAQPTDEERELMRRWVETWRRAGPLLEEIKNRELQAINTQQAIRDIFGEVDHFRGIPQRSTSGLIEQQKWFAKLRR
jgi:hypothetical protein